MRNQAVSIKPSTLGGFSIIELLIVIAILGVLIGLILMVLSKTKENVRDLNCLSNIRVLNQSMTSYATENDSRFFPYYADASGERAAYWMYVLRDYYTDAEILQCASTDFLPKKQHDPPESGTLEKITSYPLSAPDNPSGFGTKRLAWGKLAIEGAEPRFLHGHNGGYALNVWWHTKGSEGVSASAWTYPDHYFQSLEDSVLQPGEAPFMADAIYLDARVFNSPDKTSQLPSHTDGATLGVGRVYINRHGQGINIGFADGHAQNKKADKVMQQQWNAKSDWVTTSNE